ncbi:glycerophosphoryl diester phosphodiesterase membrane domain-containing protein [Microbacterium sp. NPDC089189]|uniref:glycerophosphoryl diester phosphodiesterase membrane domain-containing protein n=1 Tax=Microbacterium sp. NPDC089189 TaxID=3154972 RepID=UPI003433C54B
MTAYPSWTPAPRAGIVPLHPLSFGTILGRSFTALRQNPRVLLGFALGMQMLVYVVMIAVVGGVTFATFSRLATVSPNSPDFEAIFAGSIAITVVTGVVLGIAGTALTVIVQAVVVADVAHGVVAEKLTVGALWRRVRPAFWRLIGYTFLSVGVILLAVALVVGAVIGISFAALPVGIVLGILCVFAAIPLALWVTTKLLLVTPILVLERSGIFAAIARSWRLTRGRFWPALGVWILVQITFSAVAQLVSIPFSLLGSILSSTIAPTGASDPTSIIAFIVTTLITQIVTLLIQSVALVVFSSAATLVYVDCRMRREGLDLDLQSYVDQRHAGAGPADPYSWHIGRDVAPRPQWAAPVPPAWPAPAGTWPAAGSPAPYGTASTPEAPIPPTDAPAPSGQTSDAPATGTEPVPPVAPAPDDVPRSATDWAAPGAPSDGR